MNELLIILLTYIAVIAIIIFVGVSLQDTSAMKGWETKEYLRHKKEISNGEDDGEN